MIAITYTIWKMEIKVVKRDTLKNIFKIHFIKTIIFRWQSRWSLFVLQAFSRGILVVRDLLSHVAQQLLQPEYRPRSKILDLRNSLGSSADNVFDYLWVDPSDFTLLGRKAIRIWNEASQLFLSVKSRLEGEIWFLTSNLNCVVSSVCLF